MHESPRRSPAATSAQLDGATEVSGSQEHSAIGGLLPGGNTAAAELVRCGHGVANLVGWGGSEAVLGHDFSFVARMCDADESVHSSTGPASEMHDRHPSPASIDTAGKRNARRLLLRTSRLTREALFADPVNAPLGTPTGTPERRADV